MCGICGVVGEVRAEVAETAVRQMMAALAHRGPDDEGLLLAERVVVGMRRLSIIDLAGGHQPVFSENGRVAVVLNGEIYNFQELRRALEPLGHTFRTHSDSETVVHAYEEWGPDCVHHLRGMFAFAAVEIPRVDAPAPPRVFLARDRLGIKPLYYTVTHGALLFASEVRALLATGLVESRLSSAALDAYLLFGSVGEPMTLLEGIFSLPPGHRACVSPEPGRVAPRPEPYWCAPREKLRSAASSAPASGARGVVEDLRALLEDAVRLHLIADVPLGVFLSSGIDSTALAGLASRVSGGVHTFTVVFPEQEFSEAEIARRTAQRFGTEHQELMLTGDDMLARLDLAVAALDQPSMDGINTYFVSWAARQAGLKVALSGLGGDEVFGGYSTFRSVPRLQRLIALGRWMPAPLRAATRALALGIGRQRGRPDAARKLAAVWESPDASPHPYFFTRSLFTPSQAASLRGEAGKRDAAAPWVAWLADSARQAEGFDSFSAVSWLELRSYLVNTLLRDTDSMSMAHSLEVRVPFLDHPLVEFVANLPERVKRGDARPKSLLRAALADLLPREVVGQRKRTFTFPWENWLRGPLRERVAAGLASPAPPLGSLMRRETLQAVWQDFLAGRTSWSRPWSLYVLNEWVRRHVAVGAPLHRKGESAQLQSQ
jgi:asparagine synthase (glutamine-hydrolysing)